jgi:hypothetical protein
MCGIYVNSTNEITVGNTTNTIYTYSDVCTNSATNENFNTVNDLFFSFLEIITDILIYYTFAILILKSLFWIIEVIYNAVEKRKG